MKIGNAGEDKQGTDKIVTYLNETSANEHLNSDGKSIASMVE
jgi:hypothetical protein